ncbi:hypothetical protein N9189_02055 [Pirellulaceae bacterium]|jgi:hypothetical protein|nr:hypothetical protein [Pirellulaceae bacterium]
MDDFELFDQALRECETTSSSDELDKINENKGCPHTELAIENGVTHCIECGEEVLRDISQEKEWRYYGPSDNIHTADPNRCQIRRREERSIYKDVEGMGFPEKIVRKANEIYADVTKKKKKNPDDPDEFQIYRGTSRKSIVFACIFNAYKLNGTPETWEDLSTVFGLERKDCSTGIKHISRHAPKKSPIRTTYITPVDLVENIMDKFEATKQQKKEVVNIHNQIKNTSYKLNQSRPKSVASALVYYWIQKTGKNISMKEFTEKVDLSEITVDKLSKEIDRVIQKKRASRIKKAQSKQKDLKTESTATT